MAFPASLSLTRNTRRWTAMNIGRALRFFATRSSIAATRVEAVVAKRRRQSETTNDYNYTVAISHTLRRRKKKKTVYEIPYEWKFHRKCKNSRAVIGIKRLSARPRIYYRRFCLLSVRSEYRMSYRSLLFNCLLQFDRIQYTVGVWIFVCRFQTKQETTHRWERHRPAPFRLATRPHNAVIGEWETRRVTAVLNFHFFKSNVLVLRFSRIIRLYECTARYLKSVGCVPIDKRNSRRFIGHFRTRWFITTVQFRSNIHLLLW